MHFLLKNRNKCNDHQSLRKFGLHFSRKNEQKNTQNWRKIVNNEFREGYWFSLRRTCYRIVVMFRLDSRRQIESFNYVHHDGCFILWVFYFGKRRVYMCLAITNDRPTQDCFCKTAIRVCRKCSKGDPTPTKHIHTHTDSQINREKGRKQNHERPQSARWSENSSHSNCVWMNERTNGKRCQNTRKKNFCFD